MPYIRFERPITNLENIDTSHIHYVKSFDDAGKLIENEFAEEQSAEIDRMRALLTAENEGEE